ncbi:hypothetical protein L1049_016266 [Liquidambar formosana]|uniref:F-box domain-containing protein n=1 Tax=Liquidambar formosana TaxID=63359 RepID=A0AAP0S5D7_LIQFO
MPSLPPEIIVDILSRLPVKSLCRFRCVSKPWRTLISDPHFSKMHLTRTQNHPHNERLLLMADDSLYTVEYNESSSENVAIAVELDIPCVKSPNAILGSCDGLLLVAAGLADTCFLLNPSTRESIELPNSPFGAESCDNFSIYGFGYDSSIDDYKVVKICFDDDDEAVCSKGIVSVYSLRANSWRRIEDSPFCHSVNDLSPPGVLLNGALHWLVWSHRGSDILGVIACLDLVDEKFRDVPPPNLDESFAQHTLGVLGGCLYMLVSTTFDCDGCDYDVFVMKEYGVRESWTKFTITVPQIIAEPLCFPKNGEIMWKNGEQITLYNPDEDTSRDVAIHGFPNLYEAGMHVESLVSPNNSNGIDTIAASQILARMGTQPKEA